METVFLDTETTGLYSIYSLGTDEIVEIAIVDDRGQPIINSLTKPTICKAWPDAQRIHGISPADVASAPTLEEVLPDIRAAVAGKRVVIYNASFDTSFFPDDVFADSIIECAMLEYAEHVGDWNDFRGTYRWHKLSVAAAATGYTGTGWHRALGDALAVRHVWQYLQAEKMKKAA